MFPPKVEDGEIITLIRELTRAGQPPSGVTVRDELRRRFGCRGGVARIYRLLTQERARTAATQAVNADISPRLLDQEVRNLKQTLQALHRREEAQQHYWQQKIEALRLQVEALQGQVEGALAAGAVPETLRQELQVTQNRVGQTSVLVRAFGPATRPAPEESNGP